MKKKLLSLYGFDNRNVNSADYLEKIYEILDQQENEPQIKDNLEEEKAQELENFAGNTVKSESDIDLIQEGNVIKVYSHRSNKDLYIKLVRLGYRNLITVSHENVDGTFNILIFPSQNIQVSDSKDIVNFKKIGDYLKLSKDEILSQIFGIEVSNRKTDALDAFDYLENLFTLEIKTLKTPARFALKDNLTGYGVKADVIPQSVNIGNVIVLLNKLYYKSILSVKDKKNNNIHGFPTLKVSEPFVNIVMKLYNNEKITKHDFNILPSNETELYDAFLYLSGLKYHHYNNIDITVNQIKKRVELIEGEIEAGNNNNDLLIELSKLLHKLVVMGVLTKNEVTKHLLIIKNDCF